MQNFSAIVGDYQDQHLTYAPTRWSARAHGGPHRARVSVSGARDALTSLPRHLGEEVSIHSELGQVVWSGYVHEVEVWDGNLIVALSLDHVVNRVAVAYTASLGYGSEVRRTTDWVEDERSVER